MCFGKTSSPQIYDKAKFRPCYWQARVRWIQNLESLLQKRTSFGEPNGLADSSGRFGVAQTGPGQAQPDRQAEGPRQTRC